MLVLRARIAESELRIAPVVAEEKALTEKLLAHYAKAPADQPQIADGRFSLLQVGMCADEKQPLDVAAKSKILKWLGKDVYLALSNITFELLKGVVTPAQFKEIVVQRRTGRRSLKVVAKVVVAEAA